MSKVLAFAMGADYLEQDLVLTRDGHPIVLHDIHLDSVTDVRDRFPDRARDDGRYYAIDFTLEEIRSLQVHERVHAGTGLPVFPTRFPVGKSRFAIPTLAEEIELVQGLAESTGRRVGIYPEIKRPDFHRAEGQDISRIVLEQLEEYGYREADDDAIVQCFDPAETKRMRVELGCRLPLVQLLGNRNDDGFDYDHLRSPAGLAEIAEYAQGIGPSLDQLLTRTASGEWVLSGLLSDAHQAGLYVHAWTHRPESLPEGMRDSDELLELLESGRLDGLFTDAPDVVAQWRLAR